MENISDDVGEPLLRGGLLDTLGRFIGESPEATQRSFHSALPTAMYAIADHGSTESGARGLLEGFQRKQLPELDIVNLGGVLSNPDAASGLMASSGGFLEKTLGGKLGGLVDGLAGHSNISRNGAAKLMSIVAPLALGVIGRRARADRLDAGGLAGFLGKQKSQIATMVPGSLGSLFGISAPVEKATTRLEPAKPVKVAEPVQRAAPTRLAEPTEDVAEKPAAYVAQKPARRWWPWLLAGLVVLAGFALLGRGMRTREPVRAPVIHTPAPPAPAPGPQPQTPASPPTTMAPPAASEATAFKEQLTTYFDGADTGPKRFTLEGYNFDAQEANAASRSSGDALAAALESNPDATVTIEGFADAQGDPAANQQVSVDRANGLKSYLTAKGIAPERIETIGRGDESPVGSNGTEERRGVNGRLEVVVRK